MPNFNVVFHGMMLFAENGRYCDILFPEIKEHDYRFGDFSNGSFPQDLAPGDYEIAGIPPRARPDRFSKHADKYLVLRASDISTLPPLRRIGIRAPLPNSILFFRKIVPDKKRFGKTPIPAIFNGTPTSLAIARPTTLYDVVVFHYRNVAAAATSLALIGGDPVETGMATLGIYAQTGRDLRRTAEPGSPTLNMVHRTGINDLLHYTSGGNSQHPTFELSKIGTASGEMNPKHGLQAIHMLNLLELDSLVTDESGCVGAAVSGR
jgi:hypothetical protein